MMNVEWQKSIFAPLFQRIKQAEIYAAPPTYVPDNKPPPRSFHNRIHPLEKQMTKEVNEYFLEHWPFENEKARKKFAVAAFSEVTCLYFPLAENARIKFACELLTILFLIDDLLEDMSFDDGKEYNDHLMPIMRGDVKPDRSIPVEWMMWDLWEAMRACDRVLADEILEPTFEFMRAQTDKARLEISTLGRYLEYREKDVGKALLSSLQRFSMALHLTPAQLKTVETIEQNCSKHLSVVNDIYSFDKELRQSETGHHEGSVLCTAVKVLADESNLTYEASKRVLWYMCREWELVHQRLEARRKAQGDYTEALSKYVKGLEFQMSGNERWSETTLRYHSG